MSEIETIPAPPSFENETGIHHEIPERSETDKLIDALGQMISDLEGRLDTKLTRLLDGAIDTKLDRFARELGDQFEQKVSQIDANIKLIDVSIHELSGWVSQIRDTHAGEIELLKKRVLQLEEELKTVRSQLDAIADGK